MQGKFDWENLIQKYINYQILRKEKRLNNLLLINIGMKYYKRQKGKNHESDEDYSEKEEKHKNSNKNEKVNNKSDININKGKLDKISIKGSSNNNNN